MTLARVTKERFNIVFTGVGPKPRGREVGNGKRLLKARDRRSSDDRRIGIVKDVFDSIDHNCWNNYNNNRTREVVPSGIGI